MHYALVIVYLVCAAAGAMTAKDKEEYERRGLSQVEWQMILDAGMSTEKVDELLAAGISISEYFDYPWLELGISEQEWIRRRRAGMENADIAVHTASHAKASDWAVIQNFVLPGFHQWKRDQHGKAAIMTSVAVLSAGLTAYLSAREGSFNPLPLIVLVPDMIWSSIDIGIQIHRERNPEARRFSRNQLRPGVNVSVSFAQPGTL
jgi:hypothetical protein